MTTRELRQQLFNVSNQEMTVRELRDILFKGDQDNEIDTGKLQLLTRKTKPLSRYEIAMQRKKHGQKA